MTARETTFMGKPVVFVGADEAEHQGILLGDFKLTRHKSLCFNTQFFYPLGYLDTFGWRVNSGYINPPGVRLEGGHWRSMIKLSKQMVAGVEMGIRFYLAQHPEIELDKPLRDALIGKPK